MDNKTIRNMMRTHHAVNKNRIVMGDYVMISLIGITQCQMIAYALLHGIEWIGDDE